MQRYSILLTAVLGLTPVVASQTVVSYHNVDRTLHQAFFNNLSANGYQIKSISVHGAGKSTARYACVWRKEPGPAFVACHAKNLSEYTAWRTTNINLGYRPALFSATKPTSAAAVYAAVMVKDGRQAANLPIASKATFETVDRQHKSNGLVLTSLAKYGNDLYGGVWVEPTMTATWSRSLDVTAPELQERFDIFKDTGVRLAVVTPDHTGRFGAVWRDDVIGAYEARADLTESQYLALKATNKAANREPIMIQAAGVGSATRYCAIFAASDTIKPRTFTAVGPNVPELVAYDTWMRDFMRQQRVRAAGFAIARHGKLMYVKGYTNAEAGYPQTKPTSMFRIASCAKPLTSIAMHQAYEKGQLAPGTKIASYFNLNTPSLADPRYVDIHMDHLLTHEAGWDRNSGPELQPMFMDGTIASFFNMSMPISKANIFAYMMFTQQLQLDPGQDNRYSNFGYSILGLSLERANPGMSYTDIMRRDIFNPLGLNRPINGGTTLSELHPDEVRYHMNSPSTATSVVHADERRIARQYGGWNQGNLDSHGGLVMAAPDFAKILAAFDLGGNNPLLEQSSTTAMWTKAPKSNWLRGWFETNLPDENGDAQRVMHHGGNLWGLNAMIMRREDGLSFVLFINRWIENEMSPDREGVDLNNIANSIARWPTKDLFPTVGIPEFRVPSPQIDAPLTSMPNVTPDGFKLTGRYLGEVDELKLTNSLGRTWTVRNTDPAKVVALGRILTGRRDSIVVYPPQGLPPGSYNVVVSGKNGTSTPKVLIIITDGHPGLIVPESIATSAAGSSLTMMASRGSLSPRTLVQLTFSPEKTPSSIPGVGTLAIGNQFTSLFNFGGLTPTDPTTGTTQWSAPILPSFRGLTIHFQCYLVDPAKQNPLPVSTSNTATLRVL